MKNKNKETIYVAKVEVTLETTFQKSRHHLKCFERHKFKKTLKVLFTKIRLYTMTFKSYNFGAHV